MMQESGGDGFKRCAIPVYQATFYEKDDGPPMIEWDQMMQVFPWWHSFSGWWEGECDYEGCKRYRIIVPKGTIVRQFKVE